MEKFEDTSFSHEEWLNQIKEEDKGILTKPFLGLSPLELKTVQDILTRRLHESSGSGSKLITLLKSNSLNSEKQMEKIMDEIYHKMEMLKKNEKNYKEDLIIINGLIERLSNKK